MREHHVKSSIGQVELLTGKRRTWYWTMNGETSSKRQYWTSRATYVKRRFLGTKYVLYQDVELPTQEEEFSTELSREPWS
jgi:hypothetical protein